MVYGVTRGIVAPKGTSKAVINHWAAAIKKASKDPELAKQMDAKGTDINYKGPDEYRAWFEETYADHEQVAIEIGMFKK
jgi:tripartite-type tricarboxylate transporter receptor subunit TctC